MPFSDVADDPVPDRVPPPGTGGTFETTDDEARWT
jgi:hypothetical protein